MKPWKLPSTWKFEFIMNGGKFMLVFDHEGQKQCCQIIKYKIMVFI